MLHNNCRSRPNWTLLPTITGADEGLYSYCYSRRNIYFIMRRLWRDQSPRTPVPMCADFKSPTGITLAKNTVFMSPYGQVSTKQSIDFTSISTAKNLDQFTSFITPLPSQILHVSFSTPTSRRAISCQFSYLAFTLLKLLRAEPQKKKINFSQSSGGALSLI